jgi:hypothetical protein
MASFRTPTRFSFFECANIAEFANIAEILCQSKNLRKYLFLSEIHLKYTYYTVYNSQSAIYIDSGNNMIDEQTYNILYISFYLKQIIFFKGISPG